MDKGAWAKQTNDRVYVGANDGPAWDVLEPEEALRLADEIRAAAQKALDYRTRFLRSGFA